MYALPPPPMSPLHRADIIDFCLLKSTHMHSLYIYSTCTLLTQARRGRVIAVGVCVCVCVFSLIFVFTEFLRVLKTSLVS